MITTEKALALLSEHGTTTPQSPDDWLGTFDLPDCVKRFYEEVGPDDITIESNGNPYFLPRLSSLWDFQAGGGIGANPISFLIGNQQHVAIAADRVLYVFGL